MRKIWYNFLIVLNVGKRRSASLRLKTHNLSESDGSQARRVTFTINANKSACFVLTTAYETECPQTCVSRNETCVKHGILPGFLQ